MLYLSPSLSSPHHPPSPPVFLHVSVVDIDQLMHIIELVGTPEPELMEEFFSASVSVKNQPAKLSALSLLSVVLPLPQQEWDGVLYNFVLTFLFLSCSCFCPEVVFSLDFARHGETLVLTSFWLVLEHISQFESQMQDIKKQISSDT